MENLREILPQVLRSLQEPEKQNRILLLDKWESIVGPKFAARTRPTLSAKGDLCVWTDQSVLAFELSQKYKQTILKRSQAVLGEKTVKAVWIRVGQLR